MIKTLLKMLYKQPTDMCVRANLEGEAAAKATNRFTTLPIQVVKTVEPEPWTSVTGNQEVLMKKTTTTLRNSPSKLPLKP